ncbi:phosphatidylglycerophosphate phosphatase PTPMT2-like [Diospyros lotus]|uniref:phosphatidylglycerophosphate phosphatase PTPMT2-like n=1 Tax=Diospyros lotus TaxID=55363 RepID=UPI0022564ED5|nr:phosphatidylglycerophosphate phosphatase PTPMT2-like [Diospyros lotus]
MKIEELDEVESDGRSYCQDRTFGIQIVRVDAKRALVGAGARILFYPTLLYNVFRNKVQAEFRWWDEIDQYLLLGAVPFPKDVPRLKQLGVGGVITLNEPYETLVPTSLYHAHGIDHLVIPTRDYLFAPSFVDIDRAVDFIHQNASCGKTTYVHCKAGRGRSTTIVLCYLVVFKDMSPASALEYVRSKRPRVLLAPSQWKAVQEYKQRRLASTGYSPSVDAVLITKADLEGYHSSCDDDGSKELAIVARVARSSPMIARLSCLFASLRVSGGCGPVPRQLTEARAC